MSYNIKRIYEFKSNSVVLIFSTEGNTDPIGYDEIIFTMVKIQVLLYKEGNYNEFQ